MTIFEQAEMIYQSMRPEMIEYADGTRKFSNDNEKRLYNLITNIIGLADKAPILTAVNIIAGFNFWTDKTALEQTDDVGAELTRRASVVFVEHATEEQQIYARLEYYFLASGI